MVAAGSPLHSVAVHPSQPHLGVAGDSEGSLSFFDLRKASATLQSLPLHAGPVWDVRPSLILP